MRGIRLLRDGVAVGYYNSYMEHQFRSAGSFRARGSDGKTYRVSVVDEVERVASFGDEQVGGSEELGARHMFVGGRHVNRIDKGEYEIFGTGIKLTSDDRNAP